MQNDIVITYPKYFADGSNNYFNNIGLTLASKITDNNISHRQFLPDSIKLSLLLKPTNEIDLKNVFSCLKKGAPEWDDVSSQNVKLVKGSIS